MSSKSKKIIICPFGLFGQVEGSYSPAKNNSQRTCQRPLEELVLANTSKYFCLIRYNSRSRRAQVQQKKFEQVSGSSKMRLSQEWASISDSSCLEFFVLWWLAKFLENSLTEIPYFSFLFRFSIFLHHIIILNQIFNKKFQTSYYKNDFIFSKINENSKYLWKIFPEFLGFFTFTSFSLVRFISLQKRPKFEPDAKVDQSDFCTEWRYCRSCVFGLDVGFPREFREREMVAVQPRKNQIER